MKAAVGVLVLALAGLGCASTKITSEANVTAKDAALDTVMVIAAFGDLDMMKLGEGEITAHFASHGVGCVGSSTLFFPGSPISDEQMVERLAEHHIQTILVLMMYGTGTTDTYVPPSYYTKSSAWVSGNGETGTSATTSTTGGYTTHRPWAKFRGELIDVRTDERLWVATANSKGDDYASHHTLLRSFCGQVMNKLIEDGVVKPPPPKPSPARPSLPKHSSSKHDAHGSITS